MTAPRIQNRPWRARIAAALVVIGLSAPAQGTSPPVPPASAKPHPRENTLLKRQWGIEIVHVRLTANNYMMEFRYKVLDPQKAAPLFERQNKPILHHVSSGAAFIVPTPEKTGALRNSNPPEANHIYWMFFANPGQYVKAGDEVNIEIGPFRVDGIIVE